MTTYQYRWSKRQDSMHTITLNGVTSDAEALNAVSCWVRDLRADCPWQIIQGERVVASGTGPAQLW